MSSDSIVGCRVGFGEVIQGEISPFVFLLTNALAACAIVGLRVGKFVEGHSNVFFR